MPQGSALNDTDAEYRNKQKNIEELNLAWFFSVDRASFFNVRRTVSCLFIRRNRANTNRQRWAAVSLAHNRVFGPSSVIALISGFDFFFFRRIDSDAQDSSVRVAIRKWILQVTTATSEANRDPDISTSHQ